MVIRNQYYPNLDPAYPGEYATLPYKWHALDEELHKARGSVTRPTATISELPQHYKVEIAVPGFKREDFFVHTRGRVLSVAAMRRKNGLKGPSDPLNDTHSRCIKRNILLPRDIDTSFITAEYKDGMLTIHFFKTKYPLKNPKTRIAVY